MRVPDARKSLQVLREEWESCRACELGRLRESREGAFVFGEGVSRGVMFIGEGPGQAEDREGSPFIGRSGELLRDVLGKFGFTDYYFTNLVCCRSCEPFIDPVTNTPKMRKVRGKPDELVMRDQPPLPSQIKACSARLYEEIYLVDPIVIVPLGSMAAEFLLGRPVTITKERGNTVPVAIPGAALRPVLTDKKQVWGHKVRGEYVLPTEQNEVIYQAVLSLHPSYVVRKENDLGANSPVQQFVSDIRLAVKIYERYLTEALGVDPVSTSDADLSNIGYEHGADEDPS